MKREATPKDQSMASMYLGRSRAGRFHPRRFGSTNAKGFWGRRGTLGEAGATAIWTSSC